MFSLSLIFILFLIGYSVFIYGKRMLGGASHTYQSKFTNSALSFIALLTYIILYKEDIYIRKLNFFIEVVGIFVLFGMVHTTLEERIKDNTNLTILKKFTGPIKGIISTIIGGIPLVFPSTTVSLNNLNNKSTLISDIYFSVVFMGLLLAYMLILPKSNVSKINRLGAVLCILSWLLAFITGIANLNITYIKILSLVLSGIGAITLLLGMMLYEKLNRYSKYGVKN